MSKSDKKKSLQTLQLFLFGPGIGECVVLRLPDGQWGVVDCYISSRAKGMGVLEFLESKGVEKLAFFCLTHPHGDHYTGAHQLLRHYKGKIERLWRYGGFCTRDIQARAAAAARAKSARTKDPEAEKLADEFVKVLIAINEKKGSLTNATYRRVLAPMDLLMTGTYQITAIRPGALLAEEIEEAIAAKSNQVGVEKGFLLFNEEEGSLLNSLSIVLLIEFGRARVVLLGDAEGAAYAIHESLTEFALVKIAHHGSCNGLGADVLTERGIRCAVITPYVRSGLPR